MGFLEKSAGKQPRDEERAPRARKDAPRTKTDAPRAKTDAPRPRGLLRRIAGWILRIVLLWAIAVIGLSALYWIVPPVSVPMIGDWLTGKSVQRTYVPLEAISPHLVRAVISSEDSAFCNHSGVDWAMLGNVVQAALEDGASRGASTIPMQTAKNLFLVSSRSYLRKGLEIPLALYLNAVWSKRRMIEIYLNIAEWGNGIYGAEAAARFYFRKPARLLTPREAALLATSLPNPIKRNPARPAGFHGGLARQLLQRIAVEGPSDPCLRR